MRGSTSFVDHAWASAQPVMMDYVGIPARSPMFDPARETTGHIARAAQLLAEWAEAQKIDGASIELIEPAGLTPVLLVEIPATTPSLADRTVVMYGHLDKQPEMEPWSEGLGPWNPVIRGERLYGRGGADDGYSIVAALTAVRAVREAGRDHARIVVLIEASEESSSVHLAEHLEQLFPRLAGTVDGLPPVADAGNVFRSRLAVKLSLRLPPTADATARASLDHFGAPAASCGVGGTIPFMGMLGGPLPDAQFLLVGVLGPGSNAHGPDEFLDLPTARRLTASAADVLHAHAERAS